ncbi:hypothetical protein K431DRAFT_286994 [Polychaeton citri CBS 116435]|uniref:Uncharacterized protein n=1 Tax=Polychaeton citri CBS 116435 TaxID=1314669 RepID=A0A9P4UKJ6_9PEZI|nr:hypothetical protein K431DRAFT_286994 [Polychaeton citri CBS 116435]
MPVVLMLSSSTRPASHVHALAKFKVEKVTKTKGLSDVHPIPSNQAGTKPGAQAGARSSPVQSPEAVNKDRHHS